jgi:diketogulonate reductase-like aldo/keto reductase
MAVAEDVTDHAVKSGYRHVDSAVAYRNEEPTAKGMLRSGVPREQLFFTSKVGPGRGYEDAKKGIDETLKKTGLNYVDLYILHAPYGGRETRIGGWQALVEAVNEGKVRSIGVSNYGVHHLEELEQWQKVSSQPTPFNRACDLHSHYISPQGQPADKAGILSVNQIELHPWLARPDIVAWCKQRDIILEAYSPLIRATRMDEPALQSLASKHGKTPGQILLRWGLQQGFVILPKSVTLSRIEENRDIFDFELDEEDLALLKTGEYKPCTWDPTVEPLEA